MNTVLAWKATSKIGGTAGRAHGSVAKGLREFQSLFSELVNVRCVYLRVAISSACMTVKALPLNAQFMSQQV